MTVKLTLQNPHEVVQIATGLINKLQKINNLKFNLEIVYDYNLIDEEFPQNQLRGIYYHDTPHKIFVNPEACESIQEPHINDKALYYYGYTNDLTIFGVVIHEFCHFLTNQVFQDLMEDYTYTFQTYRLYLNEYSDSCKLNEEVAENMTLYITNPLLLKMISKDHWKFFKTYFRSPTASSVKKLYQIYDLYPQSIKTHLKEKWKIVYNYQTNKFEKLK